MEIKYILSPNPHVLRKADTKTIMRDVVIALAPVILAAVYYFRIRAVVVLATCIMSCVFFELAFRKVTRKKVTINDYSAVVTGILLALVLPPSIPYWICMVGSFVAIILTKQIFGGLGQNIFNPALLGRAFLMAAFPTFLTRWSDPVTLDAVTKATPLALNKFGHVVTDHLSLFLGNTSGSLGETCSIAIIIGGIFLLVRKVIDHRIPVAYILTVVIMSSITNLINGSVYAPALFHVLSGGLLIGALFMATDLVTSPVTKKGRWVFGIGCGVVTMVIRLWGGLPEGVMYSILLMNAATPLINRVTRPRQYGACPVPAKGAWSGADCTGQRKKRIAK